MQAREIDFGADARQAGVDGGVAGGDQGGAGSAQLQLRDAPGLEADPGQTIGFLRRGHPGVGRRDAAHRRVEPGDGRLAVGLRVLPGSGQTRVRGAELRLCGVDIAPVPIEQRQRHADAEG